MPVAGQCLNLDLVLLPRRTAAQQHRHHQIKDGNSRGIPLHLAAGLVKSQPVAGRNDSVGFSAGLAGFAVRWCNGSTEVFGAFSRGSNPRRTAN